jgi:hypothetical protein
VPIEEEEEEEEEAAYKIRELLDLYSSPNTVRMIKSRK